MPGLDPVELVRAGCNPPGLCLYFDDAFWCSMGPQINVDIIITNIREVNSDEELIKEMTNKNAYLVNVVDNVDECIKVIKKAITKYGGVVGDENVAKPVSVIVSRHRRMVLWVFELIP